MKAAVNENFGAPEVVNIKEVATPIAKEDELLIKVIASSVNIGDARIRGAKFPPGFSIPARLMFGIFKPRKKILGSTFSGTVESIGKNVKNFQVGDNVVGMSGMKMGAHAEYLTISENKPVLKIPTKLNPIDAAALPFGATTALYYLKDLGKVKQGQKLLINGASGAVGTNAIQLAKYYGAVVTAVCSGANHDLVTSLGADKVIDYTEVNFLETNEKYDLILDTVGNLSINKTLEKLNENGHLLLVVAGLKDMIITKKNVLQGTTSERMEDLEFLLGLVTNGKLKVVIDKVYQLEEIFEAYRHVDSGHKKGNVVITMS